MKKTLLASLTISLLFISICASSQNKTNFEKNGVKIKFITTQLGEISNNHFELIKDMGLPGVFVFIRDKKSIVIRHENGNDELLEVVSTERTNDGNYVFSCNKSRVLFISAENKVITYSIEGSSSLFVFPIDENDISILQTVILKF